MSYELHPLCTFFPRLDGNEFDLLRDDIKNNGLTNPIVLFDGMILDGGNRYKACIESGVEPKFIEFYGDNIADFVMSANFHRRHLSAGQRAAIVSGIQDWSQAHPSHRQEKEGCNVAPLSTVSDRASKSGASHRTQQKADKVAKADPDLAKKVGQGEVSLSKAIKQISPEKENSSQKDINGVKEALHEALSQINDLQKASEKNAQTILESQHTIVSLDEENTRLKDAIASNQLPTDIEIQDAAEIISELRGRIKALEAELDAVKSSLNSYLTENAQLKSQCNMQRNQLKKLGK